VSTGIGVGIRLPQFIARVAIAAGGRTASFAYDGTSTVTVTTGGGASFELPLLCGR